MAVASLDAALVPVPARPDTAAGTLPNLALPDLTLRGLRKSFGSAEILHGVDLEVPGGRSVALIGANGSGKSTLLRCCLRLLEPDGGTIRLLGKDVEALDRRALRRLRAKVGFVFQKHNLVPRLSALTNVLHGAQARRGGPGTWFQGLARAVEREEAMHCLDLVGLADQAAKRADALSGGQSQRVAIARALMQRPQMVFADEPVASLDPAAGEDVMTLFVDLMRDQNVTLFFTSHHLNHALSFADHLIALRSGRKVLDCATADQDFETLKSIYQ